MSPDGSIVIAPRVQACIDLFDELSNVLETDKDAQSSVLDRLGRFKIWAGNIGAFQELPLPSSLDYRLREAPKIAEQITELLEDLIDTLQDILSIVSGDKPNRTGFAADAGLEVFVSGNGGNDASSLLSDESQPESELEELLKSSGDTVTGLFRISVLIRSATTRDRYAKAAAACGEPFDAHFDIYHVGHRYPRIHQTEWLERRLGKAITRRRQYLRYCRQHRERTGTEKKMTEVDEDVVSRQRQTAAIDRRGALGSQTEKNRTGSKAPSTLAVTTASTLNVAALEVLHEISDDAQSQTSYATSMGEDERSDGLRVPPLPEEASRGLPFECPYCCTIQTIKTRREWKKHVFRDLKPYICTYEGCDLKMFAERSTWFNHELSAHRVEWRCPFCPHVTFQSPKSFERHLHSHHAQVVTKEQLSAFTETCQQSVNKVSPHACPFCDEWSTSLNYANPDVPLASLVVTTAQFQQHVGSHMEQLALFALPRDYGDRDASTGAAAGHGNHSESDLGSRASYEDQDNPPLHVAAYEGLEAEVSQLLEDGAVVTTPGQTWGNVLTAAIIGGHPSLVQLLLDHGAAVDLHASSYGYPLEAALRKSDEDSIRLLRGAKGVVDDLYDTRDETVELIFNPIETAHHHSDEAFACIERSTQLQELILSISTTIEQIKGDGDGLSQASKALNNIYPGILSVYRCLIKATRHFKYIQNKETFRALKSVLDECQRKCEELGDMVNSARYSDTEHGSSFGPPGEGRLAWQRDKKLEQIGRAIGGYITLLEELYAYDPTAAGPTGADALLASILGFRPFEDSEGEGELQENDVQEAAQDEEEDRGRNEDEEKDRDEDEDEKSSCRPAGDSAAKSGDVSAISTIDTIIQTIKFNVEVLARVNSSTSDPTAVPKSFRDAANVLPRMATVLCEIKRQLEGSLDQQAHQALETILKEGLKILRELGVVLEQSLIEKGSSRYALGQKAISSLGQDQIMKQIVWKTERHIETLERFRATSSVSASKTPLRSREQAFSRLLKEGVPPDATGDTQAVSAKEGISTVRKTSFEVPITDFASPADIGTILETDLDLVSGLVDISRNLMRRCLRIECKFNDIAVDPSRYVRHQIAPIVGGLRTVGKAWDRIRAWSEAYKPKEEAFGHGLGQRLRRSCEVGTSMLDGLEAALLENPGRIYYSGGFESHRYRLKTQADAMMCICQAVEAEDVLAWNKILEDSAATIAQSDEAMNSTTKIPRSVIRRSLQARLYDGAEWVYLDLQRKVRGPFSGVQMHKWFHSGFFHLDLQVRKLNDTAYEPLSDLIESTGDSETPFLEHEYDGPIALAVDTDSLVDEQGPPGLGGLPVLELKRRDTLQERLLAEQTGASPDLSRSQKYKPPEQIIEAIRTEGPAQKEKFLPSQLDGIAEDTSSESSRERKKYVLDDSRTVPTAITDDSEDLPHQQASYERRPEPYFIRHHRSYPRRSHYSTHDKHSYSSSSSSDDSGDDGVHYESGVVASSKDKAALPAPKGILLTPREKFPEFLDKGTIREGVAQHRYLEKEGIPHDARWTKIDRRLVNPESLEADGIRFNEYEDHVVVLKVMGTEEIRRYQQKTVDIRARRRMLKGSEASPPPPASRSPPTSLTNELQQQHPHPPTQQAQHPQPSPSHSPQMQPRSH